MAPGAVKRLVTGGAEVAVEAGAGLAASFTDDEYREAGATVTDDPTELVRGADVVGKINAPQVRDDGFDETEAIPAGALCVGMLQPFKSGPVLSRLAEQGVTAVALELVPRTTKAQRMDALSAFSTIAGYTGVIRGANELGKFFPMLTTAAGTMAQVESLGAKFVDWSQVEADAETEGGYAKEASEEDQELIRQLLSDHIAASDMVITTALVPGRPAPRLITEDMVQRMRAGSVIVDFAAEAGGNCELTVAGETVQRHGVSIMGPLDLAASLPVHGSEMYGRILSALIEHATGEDGALHIDLDDPILEACVVTHDGKVRFEA
jgi:NAD(P) transhydrogenase subunit alpha